MVSSTFRSSSALLGTCLLLAACGTMDSGGVFQGYGRDETGKFGSISVDIKPNPAVVSYDNGRCGGTWTQVHRSTETTIYREAITSGTCPSGRHIVTGQQMTNLNYIGYGGTNSDPIAVKAGTLSMTGNPQNVRKAADSWSAHVLAEEKRRIAAKARSKTGSSGGSGLSAGEVLAAGILWSAFGKPIVEGMKNSGSSTTPAAPAQSTTTAVASQNRGVTQDGDGWVKLDGRTIGRVTNSYGYNISCSIGYNYGYGSSSPLGGSFKADVRSSDEAIAVLLRACKH